MTVLDRIPLVLGSSSIWTWWILNICCCFYRQAQLKKSKKISKFVRSKLMSYQWHETGFHRKVLKKIETFCLDQNQLSFTAKYYSIAILWWRFIHQAFLSTRVILIYDRQMTVFLFFMFQNSWFFSIVCCRYLTCRLQKGYAIFNCFTTRKVSKQLKLLNFSSPG